MKTSPSPGMLDELRRSLAEAIAEVKAYEVPALCRRLGLGDGEEQEAFAGKHAYARRRILEMTPDGVAAAARSLVGERDAFEVAEVLARLDELPGVPVTRLTRRRIVALFEELPLARDIEDIRLIGSVWPIDALRAPHASGEATMAEHLHRHMVVNGDLSTREVLESLGLLDCSRRLLFGFLVAVTHPETRSGAEQAELARRIDDLLRHDGYALVMAGRISGSPYHAVREVASGSPADVSVSAVLSAFNRARVHARWTIAMERRTEDPEGAITLARTLLEDVCKWILDQAGEGWREPDDLPALYRKLAKVMRLAPDDHTEQVFRQILGSCQSVVESLGSLRNKLGDAHSPGPRRARPRPRHAELAVTLAGAMATFLVSTWDARREDGRPTPASPAPED